MNTYIIMYDTLRYTLLPFDCGNEYSSLTVMKVCQFIPSSKLTTLF